MKISEFIQRRKSEREWLNINGYGNGFPDENGEFRTAEKLFLACSLFVDIGANEGDFAKKIVSDKDGPNVFAFEANPDLANNLESVLARGKKGNKLFPVALSDKGGRAGFYRHSIDSTTSSLNERSEMMPGFRRGMEKIDVTVKVLDDYFQEIQDKSQAGGLFLKIDVEGAELNVLRGAAKVLGLDVPVSVMFEYSYGWKESGNRLKDAFHLLNEKN